MQELDKGAVEFVIGRAKEIEPELMQRSLHSVQPTFVARWAMYVFPDKVEAAREGEASAVAELDAALQKGPFAYMRLPEDQQQALRSMIVNQYRSSEGRLAERERGPGEAERMYKDLQDYMSDPQLIEYAVDEIQRREEEQRAVARQALRGRKKGGVAAR